MSVNIYNSNPNASSEAENFQTVADRGSKLASDTIYSNTTSGLNSVNVQGAIDEVNGKVENNADAISQLNSDLTASGTIYVTDTLTATNIPGELKTTFILLRNLPKGRYVVSLYCGTTGVITDGGLLSLEALGSDSTNSSFPNAPLNNPNFSGNGAVSGIITLNADENSIVGKIYFKSAHTMSYGKLLAIRIPHNV